MEYTAMIRITSRHTMPIPEFLERHDLVKRMAGEENPLDWLIGQLLPVTVIGETYEGWIVRQVVEVANAALRHDTMNGANSHVCRSVYSVKLSPEDRDYLVRTLGRHPEVRRLWDSMRTPEAVAA